MLSLLVAAATNNAIGKNGQLLWHLPKDLKYFKNLTWAMPVIMGRKTYEAVGKPLPGRTNIVISKQRNLNLKDVITVNTLPAAIAEAEATNCKELFIIGGGEIYKQTMNDADKIYMTRVHAVLAGDAFFPEIDTAFFELVHSTPVAADEKHAFAFTFETWLRKK
ncbi:MAG: dihydrofolate reductase [Ferruginibacter sp.]